MLNYKIDAKDNELTLTVSGRVDSEGTAIFQEAFDKILDMPEEKAFLDFSDLQFINSSGIGKLLIFYKKFKNTGRDVAVKGINEDVLALFKAIRLDKLMEIKR
ncbi:MAG TPA: anti-sigma factor antagonist [bacterium]|nr:anti-sigma factor antagonist [bacterium]